MAGSATLRRRRLQPERWVIMDIMTLGAPGRSLRNVAVRRLESLVTPSARRLAPRRRLNGVAGVADVVAGETRHRVGVRQRPIVGRPHVGVALRADRAGAAELLAARTAGGHGEE
ncbi:MAG: hypothetical protein HY705_02885 [Gemmatimonadetes bacterium]|nr:hypothetical protein [Gemmatimonadota bacterium]